MNDPLAAARRHIEHWKTRDNDVIADATALPFVQFTDDGRTEVHETRDSLFDFDALPPFEVSLLDCELVSRGDRVAVVALSFLWVYPEQDSRRVGKAVWGLTEIDGAWLVRWRQFVGWEDEGG